MELDAAKKSNEGFARDKHIKFFKRFLDLLPARSSRVDSSRLSIAFFAISGLEVLNALDEINSETKKDICNWIYSLQILPNEDGNSERCGFQGCDTFNIKCDDNYKEPCNKLYANGHLAMTYTGLASLVTLGDDLSRVNRKAVIQGVRSLQQDDGSFCGTQMGSENDMRFVYCAACICYMLQDWSGMDVDRTVSYISKSMSYDYGFGQGPHLESHGGVTYCAVATLTLMGRLYREFSEKQIEGLKKWAIMRQISGFQGRANKPEDTCYSFWVGATLKMLNFFEMVDYDENRSFVLTTQDNLTGGFAKWKDSEPDPLHTYLGINGLSFIGEEGLLEVDPALNISVRATKYLHKLQQSWSN